jgi:hypothetical protein
MELVVAIVLAAIILFCLRMAVLALNNAERYYRAFNIGSVCRCHVYCDLGTLWCGIANA